MDLSESARHLQQGLIAALMHVASVRLPSASALAIELDAAERAVRVSLASVSQNCTLRSIFERGLPLDIFKSSRRAQLSGDRRLLALRRRELIEALDLHDRAHYRALVRAAAQAAVRAEIEERSLFRRRVSSCERVALEDIDQAFSTTGWQLRDGIS
jgi:hypothetical protein